jgi:hypothetical protein
MNAIPIDVKPTGTELAPDPTRVLPRSFTPGDVPRLKRSVTWMASMSESGVCPCWTQWLQSILEGNEPNVTYSCGALLHDGELFIPYGVPDYAARFATVQLDEVLAAMQSGIAIDGIMKSNEETLYWPGGLAGERIRDEWNNASRLASIES